MGVAEQLRIDVKPEPERVVVALAGELDMASAPLLQTAIDKDEIAEARMLVLDLQQLQFIDSTGLRVILAVRKMCATRGQELAVTEHGPGNFSGELSQLSHRPSFVDGVAVGEVQAIEIDAEQVHALLVAEAALGEKMMRAMILRRVALV